MSSRTYNAQFLTIDFRLLDDPGFCVFMRSPAFPVYLLLRRYVWRGRKKRHPVPQVGDLFRRGYLVSAVPREVLARKLASSGVSSVSRHLAALEGLGVIRRVRTGRENVYVLGTWEDRSRAGDGRYVIEVFYLDQLHGAEPFDAPRLDDVAPGLGEDRGYRARPERSDVSRDERSDLSRMRRINKEGKRQKKITGSRRSVFEPVDTKERDDDVLYVEY